MPEYDVRPQMSCPPHFTAILVIAAVLSLGSCAHTSEPKVHARTTVFPSFTIFPDQQNIPPKIIENLPGRISALPEGRSLSINQLVKRLGLSEYRNNVSANLRWNTYFMYLDSDHILYFTMDLDTLPDSAPFLQTPWDAKMTNCSMMRNPDATIVSKDFVKKLAL